MSRDAEKSIRAVLDEFGEAWTKGTVWEVQGTPVISHKALERIAARASIRFDLPTIVRAERDEAVILVVGHRGEMREWSIGECVVNVNYRVSGKQAAYVFAMAEKRAKDRVILKLLSLHGMAYSEEEADDFKAGRQDKIEPPAEAPPLASGPSSEEIAEAIIDQLSKRAGKESVDKVLSHPKIKSDLGKMARADFDRVLRIADERRAAPIARIA